MKVAVVVFPGTNCDRDTVAAVEAVGHKAERLWHASTDPLSPYDAIVLPGALLRNDSLQFRSEWVHCRVEAPVWGLQPGAILRMPIAHGMGNYFPDPAAPPVEVALRYCDASGRATAEANPNGSWDNVAGVASGNVFGLMPHPERAISELLGSTDGRYIFGALVKELVAV